MRPQQLGQDALGGLLVWIDRTGAGPPWPMYVHNEGTGAWERVAGGSFSGGGALICDVTGSVLVGPSGDPVLVGGTDGGGSSSGGRAIICDVRGSVLVGSSGDPVLVDVGG